MVVGVKSTLRISFKNKQKNLESSSSYFQKKLYWKYICKEQRTGVYILQNYTPQGGWGNVFDDQNQNWIIKWQLFKFFFILLTKKKSLI